MKASRIIIIVIAIALIPVVFYSFQAGESPKDYIKKITEERKAKDLSMKNDNDSPFASHPKTFKPLKYFPVDLKYRVSASLVLLASPKTVTLPTSNGKVKRYLEFAEASFEIDGTENVLLILEISEPGPHRGTLFLAFADETSASETYGSGRYLELEKVPGASTILLDFNKAYNPYCAYSDNYSCPFPPAQNLLKIAIKAGEKSFHD